MIFVENDAKSKIIEVIKMINFIIGKIRKTEYSYFM
jgi:hypothetical protein